MHSLSHSLNYRDRLQNARTEIHGRNYLRHRRRGREEPNDDVGMTSIGDGTDRWISRRQSLTRDQTIVDAIRNGKVGRARPGQHVTIFQTRHGFQPNVYMETWRYPSGSPLPTLWDFSYRRSSHFIAGDPQQCVTRRATREETFSLPEHTLPRWKIPQGLLGFSVPPNLILKDIIEGNGPNDLRQVEVEFQEIAPGDITPLPIGYDNPILVDLVLRISDAQLTRPPLQDNEILQEFTEQEKIYIYNIIVNGPFDR